MDGIPIKLRVTIKRSDVEDFIKRQKRLDPVEFGFTAEHAEYIEYGTGPWRGRDKYFIGRRGQEALDEWARKKLNMTDARERRRFVRNLMWKIHHKGMKPQPYWRTAVKQVMARLQEFYDMGYTTEDIGNKIGEIAVQNMIDNRTPYKGEIERSWYIRRMSPDTVFRSMKAELRTESDLADRRWANAK